MSKQKTSVAVLLLRLYGLLFPQLSFCLCSILAGKDLHFYERLRRIPGIKSYPSEAPFVLVKLCATITSDRIWNQFVQNKILIRNCSNFHGLSDRYIRISLKTPEANQLVADKLSQFIACNHAGDPNPAEKQVA